MKTLSSLLFILIFWNFTAQEELSLEKCYSLVKTNYPLAKQKDLLTQKNDFDKEVIEKAKLPILDFSAQATYQSDVTHVALDLPNMSIPSPNKDQYKAAFTISQVIYNGGIIKSSLTAKENELLTQQKQLEVSLFQLNKQINQIYFSILLLQEKIKIIETKKETINTKLTEANAGIKNGVIVASMKDVLEAELLKLEQLHQEIDQNRISLLSTLSQLIGKDLVQQTTLTNPSIEAGSSSRINRPEIELFQLQKQQIQANEDVLGKKNAPKLLGFATTGLGNPGLNMLDNTFQPYYYVGLKFNWNVFDWNATKKQQMALSINRDIIDNQQEVFEFTSQIEIQQQQAEIDKITGLIKTDKTIIELRKKILATADSQLKNGVITPSAYTIELTNLYEAENNLSTHEIQLLLAKANYRTIQGN